MRTPSTSRSSQLIPTASPIHYVTYVRIYRYSPTVVWVGYTPGYLGTCYSPWGTVVYGTGWNYRPWIGNYWYGAPMTWGELHGALRSRGLLRADAAPGAARCSSMACASRHRTGSARRTAASCR